MHLSIVHPRKQRILAVVVVCIVCAATVYGCLPVLAECGDASLDFVGHLISGFHGFSLDQLDPTCPQCSLTY